MVARAASRPRRRPRPLPRRPPRTTRTATCARITLRIPESVKAHAEEMAAKAGQTLNTWLVNVVRPATRDGAINVDIDLSSIPFVGNDPFGGTASAATAG